MSYARGTWRGYCAAQGPDRWLGCHARPILAVVAAERHYSWVENYMEWLEGKEARAEYHALLEEELASLRG